MEIIYLGKNIVPKNVYIRKIHEIYYKMQVFLKSVFWMKALGKNVIKIF